MTHINCGGAKYFLTFIDDKSRKVFIYFLNSKSQVLLTFVNFKVMVENQLPVEKSKRSAQEKITRQTKIINN